MRRATSAGIVVALSVLIVGCSAPAPSTPPEATTEAPKTRTDVAWEDYPPNAQQLIDDAQAAGDCVALQDSFDVADAAGFTDQMRYIDEALELAGCYE